MKTKELSYRHNYAEKEDKHINKTKKRELQKHPVCAGKDCIRNPRKFIRFYCLDDEELLRNYLLPSNL